jgi:ATP/maltotriose-dependent transcriptional regulator MalT
VAENYTLLERGRQLAELAALLESARAGEGRVGLVFGEAGIGKTALLREFARVHATPPVRLFWGGCDALFTPRPLAPLQEVAWLHGGKLAAHLAEGAPRDVIFQTFLEELRHPRPPALVVIEDVQWADEATLDLLKFLGRRAERMSALLVVTWREDEVPAAHLLRSLLGDLPPAAVRRIPLGALSPAAVETLAARARRSGKGLHSATGGNPFFVTEVLASEESGVPPTVRDAVLARAARLSPKARELLDLASVVPTRVELPLLSAATGPAFAALDELLGAGMLSLSLQSIAFRHELARQALEGALPPLRARELHARILAALVGRGEEAALLPRLVHHAAGAGDAASVLRFAPAAAEHATRLGAHREAEAHLALALRYATDLPPRRRAELLEARAYECYLGDRMQDARESCSAARVLWQQLNDRARESNCLCWLSRMSWYAASNEEACRYADLAVAAAGALPPGRELATALASRSGMHMQKSESAKAIAVGDQALQLSRERGYRDIEAQTLDTVGVAHIQLGDERGWEMLEESLRLSLEQGFEDHAGRAYANLGSLAVEERRYVQAARWFDEGLAYTAEHDLGMRTLCMHAWRARLRTETGQWLEAPEDAARILDNPRCSALFRLAALTAIGLLRTRRGDPGARESLDEALALARQSDELERLVPVAAARAELAWLSGDAASALAEASSVIERVVSARRRCYAGDLALWIWRSGGKPPPAEECPAPIALLLRGDWRAASAEFERLGCSYHAALACYEADDEEAHLRALEVLDRLGARPAAARLRRRLSELGVRSVPRGPRAARREHPFDLTSREQEVLAALALGVSNAEIGSRLFVSPKTVDHHVSAILTKLGVKSRGAAVAAAQRNGLLPKDGERPREK